MYAFLLKIICKPCPIWLSAFPGRWHISWFAWKDAGGGTASPRALRPSPQRRARRLRAPHRLPAAAAPPTSATSASPGRSPPRPVLCPLGRAGGNPLPARPVPSAPPAALSGTRSAGRGRRLPPRRGRSGALPPSAAAGAPRPSAAAGGRPGGEPAARRSRRESAAAARGF